MKRWQMWSGLAATPERGETELRCELLQYGKDRSPSDAEQQAGAGRLDAGRSA
jgi:hypothetical protein